MRYPMLAALILFALPLSAFGQNQPTETEQLRAQVADLQKRVESLEAELKGMNQQLNIISDGIKNVPGEIERLRGNVEQRLDIHENILGQVAESDGQNFYPSILANMQQSDRFRHEVAKTTQATLNINNLTGAYQTMYVNGVAWTLRPGMNPFKIPLGNVTTHLAAYEIPRDWKLDDFKFDDNGAALNIEVRY